LEKLEINIINKPADIDMDIDFDECESNGSLLDHIDT
jgi:hypothetical protein